MPIDPIIEKIKKLLRMKRGGTQAEVETALAMAAALAAKYGIRLDSVDPDAEPDQPLGHIDAITSARIQWECKYAGLVCQQFFNVNSLLRSSYQPKRGGWKYCYDYKITFIGTASDTEIALYVYRFLVGHFRRCWNKRSGRCRNRQAFLYGMYIGLCSKLEEQKKQQISDRALVFLGRELTRRNAYTQQQFGDTTESSTEPDGDAKAAKWEGYIQGRKTEIRPAIDPSKKQPLQLDP